MESLITNLISVTPDGALMPNGLRPEPQNNSRKGKGKKMANEVASTGRKGREWSAKFNRNVKFYDENFDYQTKPITGEITPATDLQGAYSLGLSQDEIVRAVNDAAKAKLIEAKTAEAMGSNAVSEDALMKFIAPYREIPRFKALNSANNTEGKAAQTKAIIEKIKSDEDLVAALRAAAVETEETAE